MDNTAAAPGRGLLAVSESSEEASSALTRLKGIRARRYSAELELRAARADARPAISAARKEGHTWLEIADTLGITRQAVHLLMKGTR